VKGALAELLPRQEQTLLLRACVLGGESGADAWAEWSARNPDPVAGLPATTTEIGLLLPLLNHGLEAAGVRLAEGELSTALRAASLREQRRAAVLHRGVTAALEALHKSGIEVTVVGGVELAERAWPRSDLRHTHDLDLLVDECEIRRAAASLRQLGGVGPLEPSCRGDLELTHLEGAPVFLHTNPYVFRGATPPLAEVLARSERAEIGGAPAQVLARGDALVRTIGQGLCARPGGVKWVPDAWFAANAGPIDWEQLAATAGRSRLAVVVHTGLAYLVHGLGLEVPVGALERLARLAERADRAERDTVALAVMRARRRRGLRADPHALPRTGLALARRAPVYLRERLAGSRA
jgi:hypothetical protein